MSEELTAKKRAALNRLKTVRGHLDAIVRMLESDAYCVDPKLGSARPNCRLEKKPSVKYSGRPIWLAFVTFLKSSAAAT